MLDPRPVEVFQAGAADPVQIGPGLAARHSEFGEDDRDSVNVAKAVAFSILLPGAGQWYAGTKGRAGVFFAGEALTWTLFAYFRTVSDLKEDDYHTYARVHAGVDPSGKDDEFYRVITFYDSRERYNDQARLLAPLRRYYPNTSQWAWQWDEPASMQRYRSLRNQSNEASDRARFTLGALVLQRVVAAVDAWRTAKSINRRARMELGAWKVRVKGRPNPSRPSLAIIFSRQL